MPSVAGCALRHAAARVRAWVDAHRLGLSLFSHCNLVCIAWQTLSSAAGTLRQQSAGNVLAVLAVSTALHVVLLLFMHVAGARLLKLPARPPVAPAAPTRAPPLSSPLVTPFSPSTTPPSPAGPRRYGRGSPS